MALSPLTALSPLDGRYQRKVAALSGFFSEFGLIRFRVQVEIAWLKAISTEPALIGPIVWRPIDNQSTMGAYVGRLAKKQGKGVMVNWRYADGALFLPTFEEVRALRKE